MAPLKRTAHDLRHCTMNLIDCVAHAHGGGAWPLLAFHVEEDTNDKAWTSLYLDESKVVPEGWAVIVSRLTLLL